MRAHLASVYCCWEYLFDDLLLTLPRIRIVLLHVTDAHPHTPTRVAKSDSGATQESVTQFNPLLSYFVTLCLPSATETTYSKQKFIFLFVCLVKGITFWRQRARSKVQKLFEARGKKRAIIELFSSSQFAR